MIYYSKPSADILKESRITIRNDRALFRRQCKVSRILIRSRNRERCIVCATRLGGELFRHRSLDFILCKKCGHIQTKALPPQDYPGIKFKTVYPKLNHKEFLDKKKRIYRPKLDWIMDSLKRAGFVKGKAADSRWLEIGCGAGYFLACLHDRGIKNFLGIDTEKGLINTANRRIDGNKVRYYNGDSADIFKLFPSDIYVAFFVMEHIRDTHRFLLNMRSLRKGTIFIFSVPVFGISCLLEGVFKNNFARNLDCAFHTQLYTDDSIKYAMELAGFKIISQWVFGEDALDFNRFLILNLSNNYPKQLMAHAEERLLMIQDPFQSILDKERFSDQRHIIGIKQ